MAQETADLVIVNARVKAMNGRGTVHQAVAVKNGRISAVGTDAEISPLPGQGAEVIDAKGRSVLPGFTDGHTHWGVTADALAGAVLCGTPPVESIDQIIELGRQAAARTPRDQWIILQGSNFQYAYLKDKRPPSPAELDQVSSEHPVLYKAILHETVLNHRGLQVAGITRDSVNPPGATIERDASGEPTGVLVEMWSHLPISRPTQQQVEDTLKEIAWTHFLAEGVTSVSEIWLSRETMKAQARLIKSRQVPLRIQAFTWVSTAEQMAPALEQRLPEDEPGWLEFRGIKLFSDGGSSTRAAAFHDDYEGTPGKRGHLTFELPVLRRLLRQADDAGSQIMVHAIGDRAQDQVLDAFEQEFGPGNRQERRHRVEHGANLCWNERRAARFKQLGILPAPNPEFISGYGDYWPQIIGDRAKVSVPLRTLLDQGFEVPGTSDTTGGAMELLHPLHNMWRSTTRVTRAGVLLDPEQRITVEEALTMYTRYGAAGTLDEAERGTIEVRKLGDLVVLNTDVDQVTPDEMEHVRVDHTIVDGKVVYSRG